jgi:hypothetical protein
VVQPRRSDDADWRHVGHNSPAGRLHHSDGWLYVGTHPHQMGVRQQRRFLAQRAAANGSRECAPDGKLGDLWEAMNSQRDRERIKRARPLGSRAWSTPTPASASGRCCASPSFGRPSPQAGEGFHFVIAQIPGAQETHHAFITCDRPPPCGATRGMDPISSRLKQQTLLESCFNLIHIRSPCPEAGPTRRDPTRRIGRRRIPFQLMRCSDPSRCRPPRTAADEARGLIDTAAGIVSIQVNFTA